MSSNAMPSVNALCPIAENTANPEMKLNMELAIAITQEFEKAGSLGGICEPYAVTGKEE